MQLPSSPAATPRHVAAHPTEIVEPLTPQGAEFVLQSAYVLHYRPYRETSLLVELLTRESGRVSAVARGARREKSNLKGLLQPFTPLLVNWQGKSELVTLISAENDGQPYRLKEKSLLSGFYLNEMLLRVLPKSDPHEKLFDEYKNTLENLSKTFSESILRIFEKRLLNELGYGLSLLSESDNNISIDAKSNYYFSPEHGFSKVTAFIFPEYRQTMFSGEHLLAIAEDCYDRDDILHAAKRLMRLALQPLLGDKPLKSRELFL